LLKVYIEKIWKKNTSKWEIVISLNWIGSINTI
jgi:hypothetical protein